MTYALLLICSVLSIHLLLQLPFNPTTSPIPLSFCSTVQIFLTYARGCVCVCVCVCVYVYAQSFSCVCPTLCDLVDYSLPGSSVHEIFQTRILEWVVISSSRESSLPVDTVSPVLQAVSLPLSH